VYRAEGGAGGAGGPQGKEKGDKNERGRAHGHRAQRSVTVGLWHHRSQLAVN
jgi:hypothetical protein